MSRMFATQLSAVPPVITRRVLRVDRIRCSTMWKSASSKTSCTAAALFTLSIVWLVVAVAVSATVYHAYAKSGAMARLFGAEGTSVITRLSAFLLLCIGVQIMITGIVEVGRSI